MNKEYSSILLQPAFTTRLAPEKQSFPEDDRPHEECGIIAVIDPIERQAAQYVYHGLLEMQHRGYEGAGIANQKQELKKGEGKVNAVFSQPSVSTLEPTPSAIGHVRYGTSMTDIVDKKRYTHPHHRTAETEKGFFSLMLAQNGDTENTEEIRSRLVEKSDPKSSDSELIATLLVQERPKYETWMETFKQVLPTVKGAINLVMNTEDGMTYAVKGEDGIRPLCLGKMKNGGWVVASESVAFDNTHLDAEYVRELQSGEIMSFDSNGNKHSEFYGDFPFHSFCSIELLYFMRLDSHLQRIGYLMDGRNESGKLLAKIFEQKGIQYDCIVPVLDSGKPAALGVREYTNKPYREDLIRRREEADRSFNQPDQKTRQEKVRQKFHPVPLPNDKRIIAVVDDSMVRQTTMIEVVSMLRKKSLAKEVHVLLSSDMMIGDCNWGVDMKRGQNLPAAEILDRLISEAQQTRRVLPDSIREIKELFRPQIEKELATLCGADTVTFLPIDIMLTAFNNYEQACTHCTTREHPRNVEGKSHHLKREVPLDHAPRTAIMASGNGSNMENIMNHIESGNVSVDLQGVIIGKEGVNAIHRAQNHGIPSYVHPYEGKMKKNARSEYEKEVLQQIDEMNLDLIVMAGWMFIFSDEFLQEIQKRNITMLNLHPALLSPDGSAKVMTSKQTIDVVRGAHAIDDVYKAGIETFPVSGVTIHQVHPKKNSTDHAYDVGGIILQEEVPRRTGETLDEFEQRIHLAEYQALPTAINYVANAMKKYDVSRGDFPW